MNTPHPKQTKRGIVARIFSYCINKLWLLLASLIILTALIHVLLGFFIPEIDRYRDEIVEWVEQTYDINVDVEKISAEWTNQGPVIALYNFKIKSDDDLYNIVEIGDVSLYFDMIASLWDGRFSTQEIIVNKANLKFYLDKKLSINLNTPPLKTSSINIGETSQKLIDLLFSQKQISIKNSTLKLYTLEGAEFEYQVDRIKVEKFNNNHQLSGKLNYGNTGEITLVTELFGDPKEDSSFSDIYVSGSNINIADIPWLNSYPVSRPSSGELSWQFWGTWREKHWQSVKALVNLKDANWSESNEKMTAEETIDNELTAMMSWQQEQADKGYLSVHHLSVRTPSANETSLAEIFVRYHRANSDVLSWDFSTQEFSLGAVADYLANIFDETLANTKFLKGSKFSVTLDRLNASIIEQNNVWNMSKFDFEFSKLSYERWNSIPRANGLTGIVSVTPQGGKGVLSASDINLDFGELFRHKIKAEKLVSNFDWTFSDENQLRLNINHFNLSNPDLTIQAKAAYFFQDKLPILSLYAELIDVNAVNKSRYLPSGIMTKNLVNYLDNGVKSGNLPLIKSIVRGPLNEFPFANTRGIFVAYGELKNAVYQYLPDWPSAKELNAKLLFEGNSMDIVASHAKSEKNIVLGARAITKDFSVEKPLLKLSFDVASKDNSGRNFISKTPINFISDTLETIDYQGNMKTHIDLDVPLSGHGDIKLNGAVKLDPKTSKIHTSVINVSKASGTVKFTEKGVSKSDLSVFYLGKELQVELRGKEKPTSPSVSLDVKGILPAEAISHFIGERWRQYFEGEATFSSFIQFSPVDEPEITRVLFQSDFYGISFDFPDKFKKKAQQKEELFLTLELGTNNKGEVRWRDLDGKWYWNNLSDKGQEKIDYGGDFFINQPVKYLKNINPNLRVSADIETADLQEWLLFIDRLSHYEKAIPDKKKTDQELIFESISANIKQLNTPVVTLIDSQLHINKMFNKPWQVKVTGKQGNIDMVLNPDLPWMVSLTDIDMDLNEDLFKAQADEINKENKQQSYPVINHVALLPKDIVDMDITCKGCIIQGVDYGDLLMKLRSFDDKVEFATTVVKVKQHDLSLSGSWQVDKQQKNKTHIEYELATVNAGELLKNWDLDVGVKDSSGVLSAKMSWNDKPWSLDYREIEGEAQLHLGKGYLSEINDGDGRLFSLFNLQSLVRKLTFDFKDVFQKGFFYDSITGTFQLHNGILSTDNVEIMGNVADVKLFGETNVKTEQIEQIAVVTPHLTSSLPVLAAWAIEPTTGLIVFLLDKIMEPAIEVATRIDYRIHGNYDKVIVDKLKMSKKKIKVEYESEVLPEEKPETDPNTKEKQPSVEPIDKK